MKIKKFATILAIAAMLLVGVSTAYAKKPLEVDCDILAATTVAVNDFLEGEGIDLFDNLGQFVATSILDDDVFDQLNALILLFSGGQIEFTSASQIVTTSAHCRLIPQLIGTVRD